MRLVGSPVLGHNNGIEPNCFDDSASALSRVLSPYRVTDRQTGFTEELLLGFGIFLEVSDCQWPTNHHRVSVAAVIDNVSIRTRHDGVWDYTSITLALPGHTVVPHGRLGCYHRGHLRLITRSPARLGLGLVAAAPYWIHFPNSELVTLRRLDCLTFIPREPYLGYHSWLPRRRRRLGRRRLGGMLKFWGLSALPLLGTQPHSRRRNNAKPYYLKG
jgi:hypothetical protein